MTELLPTALPTLSETASFLSGFLDSLPGLDHFFGQFLLADASAVIRQKLQEVLNILMLFGFLVGTIRIMGGATQMRRGESEEGKSSIVSGALIAAAPLIMKILFEIFFNSSGVVFGI